MSDRRFERNKPAEQTPLFAEKSERIVVGTALQDKDFFWWAHAKIRPSHFATPRLARIWAAMVKAVELGKTPSVTWVPLYIQGDHEAQKEEPILFYCQVLKGDALEEGFAHAELHGDTVFQLANKRALVDSLEAAKQKVLTAEFGVSPEDMQDTAMRTVGGAIDFENDGHIRTYDEWGEMVFKEAAANYERGEEGGIGLSSGLRAVDEVIGRLMGGKTYLIAGMSGAGKSALVNQILEGAMKEAQEKKLGWAYMASLEMQGKEYAARGLARAMGVSSEAIEMGSLDASQVEALGQQARRLKRFNIEIDSTPRMTMDVIRSHVLRTRNRRGKIALVAIDHLVIIQNEKGESLFDKISSATMKAKDLSKELDCPVIMLAQIDEKKLLESASKWPNATHLFGGQTAVQNSDVVAFIHQHELVLSRTEPSKSATDAHDKWVGRMEKERGKAHFFNDKRRGGKGRETREMLFHGATMTFSDFNGG